MVWEVEKEEESMNKEQKIHEMLKLVKFEVKKYKQTKNEMWLYQASEKVWTTYVLLIEILSNKELKSRKDIDKESWKLIRQNKILRDVYEKANVLHVYHYEGRLSIPFVKQHINYVSKMVKLSCSSRAYKKVKV